MPVVRRFALLLTVALLTAGFSGTIGLIVPEPCSLIEASDAPDGDCSPTCATCGCCARPTVPALIVVVAAGIAARGESSPIETHAPTSEPAGIFHVPRRSTS